MFGSILCGRTSAPSYVSNGFNEYLRRFKPIKRDMNYLFPPSMSDWLPEHHLARFIVEIVEQLDLKAMERAYGTSGSDPCWRLNKPA